MSMSKPITEHQIKALLNFAPCGKSVSAFSLGVDDPTMRGLDERGAVTTFKPKTGVKRYTLARFGKIYIKHLRQQIYKGNLRVEISNGRIVSVCPVGQFWDGSGNYPAEYTKDRTRQSNAAAGG